MKDFFEEYIDDYKKVFENRMKQYAKSAEVNEKVANLGSDVLEDGARKLLKKNKINIEEIEKSNKQLTAQLQKRIKKIDAELSHIPEDFEADRRRLTLVMQQAARPEQKDPCLWSPLVIFNDIPRAGGGGCRVEISSDVATKRMYPIVIVRGTGWSGMQTGEVYCEYIWAFYSTSSGRYLINPQLEFHGRIVQTREHHCYADTSGSGYEYRITMGHAQPPVIPSPIFTDMEGTLPYVSDTFRYDGFRTPNYMPFLFGHRWTYIHVGIRFRASARSRYATVQVNFGDPGAENYIEMPWLCWLPPGEWP